MRLRKSVKAPFTASSAVKGAFTDVTYFVQWIPASPRYITKLIFTE